MFRWGSKKPKAPAAPAPPHKPGGPRKPAGGPGAAAPPLPDEDELNQMFEHLLEDLAIPSSKRGEMMKQPKALKWKLICTHQDNLKRKRSAAERTRPEHFVKLLEQRLESLNPTQLVDVRVQLSTSNKVWLEQFFEQDGFDALMRLLSKLDDQIRYVHARSLHFQDTAAELADRLAGGRAEDDDEDTAAGRRQDSLRALKLEEAKAQVHRLAKDLEGCVGMQYECLRCVKAAMNSEQGLELVTTAPEVIRTLALNFDSAHTRVCTLVLELLSVATLYRHASRSSSAGHFACAVFIEVF